METSEVLDILRKSDALLEGHFELRSGLHSNRFFQCANVLRYPRRAAQLCDALAARVRKELASEDIADAVISPALGGILVGHEIARALDLPSIFAEKQDGKLVMRRFKIQPGTRYVVAEDVITRGGRVQETIDIVKEGGGVVAAVLVLVDRSGGKARFEAPLFSLMELEPVTYEPDSCPLCKENLELVHPGS